VSEVSEASGVTGQGRRRKVRVLHLIGLEDDGTLQVEFMSADPKKLRYACLGNVDLLGLIDNERFRVQTVMCGALPSDPVELARPDVILNAICDPDSNDAALKAADQIIGQVGCGVVNVPDQVRASTRDRISTLLADVAGLVVPPTARVTPTYVSDVAALVEDGTLSFPFLFREAGSHGGIGLVLVEGADDLRQLERYAFDGRSFYATGFVDFRSADGLYRKHRALVIGGQLHRKHLIATDQWNIHAENRSFMKDRPELQAEEEAWVEHGPLDEAPFAAIHDLVGLDFFGVDFGVLPDGRLLIFEVNACARALQAGQSESRIVSHAAATEAIRTSFADMLRSRVG
jgi:glutathione synthase/RimK-type ligase-like ATP-grasp enzyme